MSARSARRAEQAEAGLEHCGYPVAIPRRHGQARDSRTLEEAALLHPVSRAATAAHEVARDSGLVRTVGTWGMTFAIINGVVGAGIFSLPAAMAATAGARAPLAYIACAVAMTAVVICFAEASSRVATSGGSYGYVEAAFGRLPGFVAGVLLWLSSVLACGGIAAAFADGLGALVPALSSGIARGAMILLALGGLAWINIAGVSIAARFIGATTVIKLVPLLLFVVIGAIAMPGVAADLPAAPTSDGFGRAVILALFAFCGMESPLGASGEVAEPQRTIPRALFWSMGFVALLYIAIQIVAQGLLGPRLPGSATPLADGMAVFSAPLGLALLIGATFSRLSWITSDLFGAPRVLFAFARDGMLPQRLAAIHPSTRTPHVAILVHAGLAAACAISGTFETLAILSSLTTAALYFLSCAAAWRLARTGVAVFGRPLGFRALPAVAVIGMASMVALVLLAQWAEIAGLVIVIAASIGFYRLQAIVARRAARA